MVREDSTVSFVYDRPCMRELRGDENLIGMITKVPTPKFFYRSEGKFY